ncbi:uncharacterized protein [Taeniopygia guttata]|uniref:uncharacterized protein n=1 Tax=Taeniopygia guttata TaxID=59729 RepID=UPI003BB91ACF
MEGEPTFLCPCSSEVSARAWRQFRGFKGREARLWQRWQGGHGAAPLHLGRFCPWAGSEGSGAGAPLAVAGDGRGGRGVWRGGAAAGLPEPRRSPRAAILRVSGRLKSAAALWAERGTAAPRPAPGRKPPRRGGGARAAPKPPRRGGSGKSGHRNHRDGAEAARAAQKPPSCGGSGKSGSNYHRDGPGGARGGGERGGVSVSAVTPVLRKALWKELGAAIQDPEATVKLQILSKLLPPPGSRGLHNLMDCLPAAPERAGNEERWAACVCVCLPQGSVCPGNQCDRNGSINSVLSSENLLLCTLAARHL